MIKVIIVDDHKMFLDGLIFLIEKMDGIECVGSAINAAQLLDEYDLSEVDIVILDVKMPDMDGIELHGILKIKYPKLQTLLLSTYSDKKRIQKAIEQGVSGYIVKDKGAEELETAIRKLGEGKTHFSEKITEVMADLLRDGMNENEFRNMLTPREMEVTKAFVIDSLSGPEVAEKLFISEATVATHKRNIYSKFNVNTINHLIRFVNQHNLFED